MLSLEQKDAFRTAWIGGISEQWPSPVVAVKIKHAITINPFLHKNDFMNYLQKFLQFFINELQELNQTCFENTERLF